MTVSVYRNADGTFDIGYSDGVANVTIKGAAGSFVDDMAEKAAPAAPADASQPANAPADAQAVPATPNATAAPVASGDPAAVPPYKCPQCGQAYDGPGICANEHPPAEVVPIAAATAGPAGAGSSAGSAGGGVTQAAPAWPDQAGSQAP